ncbi:MAG: hypothetical protein A2268_04005 [Candidatus Raymondbacteria bacterium RifOxyA12_full_50_37]|uniref:Uncharacterized protein n=1 Tax=Candidatus Raymondbacteria bacterium RIFOXYD12_FULL_49_13 TaxID=1817890 RepID=A0A1F7FB87_UNCRA|nr:MAG: hypothetical protein A2268_04005 [Candidatus Raymondbacteria bacterium RifOxyA12_full_50_37]OGJ92611.1 MAG: hypothetical protein A2248_05945 [Candidatus Raymondbacteria bacterium RIFOXYA2_FULL_49_16]OGJ97965.1 MAG: hypothetical protein A2453_02970 [Candidatus Raymondbacteria bacterium RIFOXYC2_FULL_50_21]OGJ98620.1 MAG: hypothetical protein A2487_05585 [Candidatus Raymondbacteria bacterium RifOxyC12_full_50_8]OGK01987.1 MAG: hypothetical protein A2350_21110 [Candidatus Raymondbacteria b
MTLHIMKNRKIVKNTLGAVLAVISILLFSCSKDSPTGPEEAPFVHITCTKNSFSGQAITFYAVFSTPVVENTIEWHLSGREEYRASVPITGLRRITRDTLVVNWNNITAPYVGQNAADTVYVFMKNSNEVSNQIVISLKNHVPVLDSVKMNRILLGRNTTEDTINIIRVHMNPTVGCTLSLFIHDVDQDHPSFFIKDLPDLINPNQAMDSVWVLPRQEFDTVRTGQLLFTDGKGGMRSYPFEIVVYSEVHSVWVASTYGPNSVSPLSKITNSGKKLFTLNRFQQVKFLEVFPTNKNGSEAVWVLDRTIPATKTQLVSDTLFILDDDGRVLKSVGGFKEHVRCFTINKIDNIAYAVDSNTVKRITQDGKLTTDFTLASGRIEAMDVNQYNPNTYWIGIAVTSGVQTKRYICRVLDKAIVDTVNYDSLDKVVGIAAATRNNIYWVAGDGAILLVDMTADTVIAEITGFRSPQIVANQVRDSLYCWVADVGNNRVVRLTANAISGSMSVDDGFSSGLFITTSGTLFEQPRAIALDYSANPPVLWVADYGNYRIVKVNAVNGIVIGSQIDLFDLELENSDAISVNVGIF